MRAVVPRPDPARSAQRRKLAGGTRAERSAKRATKKRRPVRADPARSAQRRKLAGGTRAERSAKNVTSRRRQNENCYTTCYGKNKRSCSEIDCILSLGCMINFVTEGNCRLKKNTLGVPIRSWALLQYLYNSIILAARNVEVFGWKTRTFGS